MTRTCKPILLFVVTIVGIGCAERASQAPDNSPGDTPSSGGIPAAGDGTTTGPASAPCAGKQCGPDGRGGSCGQCAVGLTCTANQTCEPVNTPGSMPCDVSANIDPHAFWPVQGRDPAHSFRAEIAAPDAMQIRSTISLDSAQPTSSSIVIDADENLYVAGVFSGQVGVHSFRSDSTWRWTYPTSAAASTPALAKSGLFFAAADGNIYAVSTSGQYLGTVSLGVGAGEPSSTNIVCDTAAAAIEGASSVRFAGAKLDMTGLKWTIDDPSAYLTPIVAAPGGIQYFSSVTSVDPMGHMLWSNATTSSNVVISIGRDGSLYNFDGARTMDGTTQWRITPNAPDGFGSTALLADNSVAIGSAPDVYVFDRYGTAISTFHVAPKGHTAMSSLATDNRDNVYFAIRDVVSNDGTTTTATTTLYEITQNAAIVSTLSVPSSCQPISIALSPSTVDLLCTNAVYVIGSSN